jgi:hypothetical protein
MPKDLTAILVKTEASDEELLRAVIARDYGDVLCRVAPLSAVGLRQVEVHNAADGLPCEDPELVGTLSKGGRAAFVHVNHQAKQAIVHAFVDGQPVPGFAGEPGEAFDAKLNDAIGESSLDKITDADDGSRLGIGVASSRTVALVRGAVYRVPAGTPTEFGSFGFHDRGLGLDDKDERMAVFSFDPRVVATLFSQTPGKELAEILSSMPPGAFGPLEGARPQAIAALQACGEQSAEQTGLRDIRVLELAALACARAFAGGDRVAYWDERVLPIFSLADAEPKIDPAEVEDLDDCDSILHAMVEIMPWSAPPNGEGAHLAAIGDDELGPLAPWAKPGDEYTGSILLLKMERLFPLVRSLDGQKLDRQLARFEKAWYRAARPGQPEGDAYQLWRRAHAEEGAKDVDRALRCWTELRIVLEIAAANELFVALLFYEGA